MAQTMNARQAVVEWFESDFKEAAKATTKTSRLEDGRLSYRFSVVNNSGFNFDKFSFRIKVINKADNSEIGTASINAGAWADGETKNFKSKLSIPADVRSLSFVMYANSLEFEGTPTDMPSEVSFRSIGDAITGADGSGGVFGELFGTGGMPGADSGSTVTKTTTTRSANGTGTRTTTTTTTRKSGSGTVNAGGAPGQSRGTRTQTQSFSQRKTDKKLNKMRLGKSAWFGWLLGIGIFFALGAAVSSSSPEEMIGYGVVGAVCLAAAGILKLILGKKAKRIRTYEANINKKGNTSLDDLSAASGRSFNDVVDDLQAMIADGFFPGAYVDVENRLLVMTRNGEPLESVEKSAAINNKARRKAARDKGVVPQTLDDLITMTDDAELKAKLKSLRAITKKIDQRVEEVPELEKQVKDFREKYYPEVVRLTDDYNDKIADMGRIGGDAPKEEVSTDASGAPVINVNTNYLEKQAEGIKVQLVSLIDSVIEASENLLEKLHEDDIMDITTDIQMLQTTLASRGLLDSDFDI